MMFLFLRYNAIIMPIGDYPHNLSPTVNFKKKHRVKHGVSLEAGPGDRLA
jgi:hypothetical protein